LQSAPGVTTLGRPLTLVTALTALTALTAMTALSALTAMTALSGCGFGSPGIGPGADPEVIPPSPTPPAAQPCRTDEQGVALCVDFEDRPLANQATDRSPHGNHAAAVAVGATLRLPGEQAAVLTAASSLRVRESAALDLAQLTIEMWILPDQPPPKDEDVGLFDNPGQYTMRLTDELRVRCSLLGDLADDADGAASSDGAVPKRAWSHVACRYAAGELRVYLNGHLSACRTVGPIAQLGLVGSAIGSELGLGLGPLGGAEPKDRFIGGIDNVRIYDRALADARICAAAGQAPGSCQTECPDDDDDSDSDSGSGGSGE
jgi:hypothetical protein